MKYDFHDTTILSQVRSAITELLMKFDDAKTRLNITPTKNMDCIFKQFIVEAHEYRNTQQYALLKAYETNCAHEQYFSKFNFDFFNLLREPNRTIGDFMTIVKAIDETISMLYRESCYISENYL